MEGKVCQTSVMEQMVKTLFLEFQQGHLYVMKKLENLCMTLKLHEKRFLLQSEEEDDFEMLTFVVALVKHLLLLSLVMSRKKEIYI